MDRKVVSPRNRHQLHLWLGTKEYELLHKLSRETDEPMSRILRRLIRQWVTVASNHPANTVNGD